MTFASRCKEKATFQPFGLVAVIVLCETVLTRLYHRYEEVMFSIHSLNHTGSAAVYYPGNAQHALLDSINLLVLFYIGSHAFIMHTDISSFSRQHPRSTNVTRRSCIKLNKSRFDTQISQAIKSLL